MKILLSFRDEQPKRPHIPRSKLVEAGIIQLGNVFPTITAYGRLTSTQPVKLYSEVSGTLLKGNIPFLPGQSFRKGDLLIKIDDRQIKLDLNSTKSDFLSALAAVLPEIKVDFPGEFSIWQSYFNSCSFDKKLPPLPEASNQQIKLFLTRFNVYKLYFTASNLEILLEKHSFHAPFDGTIVSTDLRVGSNARTGTSLGEIINLEDMEVEVPVPAEDIEWIDYEEPVLFTSTELSGTWHGRIKRIGRSIDAQTQSIPVFLTVDRTESVRLFDGLFLKAQIPCKAIENAVSIPRKSVYEGRYVYLIVDGKLDYREITITRKEEDSFITTAGLVTGDTLVIETLQGVSPGMLAKARLSADTESSFNE